MSVKVMAMVWDRTDLSQSETLVALALADHANDEGFCWPTISRIADKARLKDRQTQRVIRRLEAIGIISVEREVGRRHSNKYLFHDLQKGVEKTPFINGVTERREKVSPDAIKGVIAKTPESSRTVIEPPKGLDEPSWQRWVEYRIEVRKPIKPASILAAQRKLAGFGADQAAVVEQSIANGWQGLFALKDREKQKVADQVSKEARVRAQILDLAKLFGMEQGDEEWVSFRARVLRANDRRLERLRA